MQINKFQVLYELGQPDLKKRENVQTLFVERLMDTHKVDDIPKMTIELLTSYPDCDDDRQVSAVVRSLILGGDSEFSSLVLRAFTDPFLDVERSDYYPEKKVGIGVLIGLLESANRMKRSEEFLSYSWAEQIEFLDSFAKSLTEVIATQLHPHTEHVSKSAEKLAWPYHSTHAFKKLFATTNTYAKGPKDCDEEHFKVIQLIRSDLKRHAEDVDTKIRSVVSDGSYKRHTWSQVGAVVIKALTVGSLSSLDAEVISGMILSGPIIFSEKHKSPNLGLFI